MSATKTPFSQRIQRLFLGEDSQADRNFAFSMLLVVLLGAAHLAYTNLGADAGAANCLEEQEAENTKLTAQLPLLLLRQSTSAHTEYRLSKLNPSGNYRWMVTEPETPLSIPCPTSKTVDQLPYIAAPEPPESSNPRAREQYERAQRKYEAMQARTKPATEWMFDQEFTQLVPEIPALTFPRPLQLGISEKAAIRITPCPSSRQKTNTTAKPTERRTPQPAVQLPRRTQAPTVTDQRLTTSSRDKVKDQPLDLIETDDAENHIAYFVDGQRVKADCTGTMSLEQIESVDVIKGDAEMVMLGLEGYEGTIMVTTKKEGLAEAEVSTFSISSPDEDLKAMEDSYSVDFNQEPVVDEADAALNPCPWL